MNVWLLSFFVFGTLASTQAFLQTRHHSQHPVFSSTSRFVTEQRRMGELTQPEQTVFDVLEEVSKSGYAFRIVVVGSGAILESTVKVVGPVIKITQSPSTGSNMMTLASSDQAFEFHVRLSDVSKISMLEKETPAKTLRVIRLLNSTGDSLSSLILADDSDAAHEWYHELVQSRGSEMQL